MSITNNQITNINKIWQEIYDETNKAIRTLANVSLTIDPGDINIGTVEIKDSDTNDKLKINADGSINVSGVATENTLALLNAKLPTASLLGDAQSNPTVTKIGAENQMFNGSTWDRMRGTIANGLDVDVTRVQGIVSVSDLSDTDGVEGSISVSTTAVEAKVGASPLVNRKTLTIFNNTSTIIYWGYNNSVTTGTGVPIRQNQFVTFAIGPNLSIFLISAGTSNDVRITESS